MSDVCSFHLYSVSFFFFFKQKTAYEIGTGDWSSDVCSSDLLVDKETVDSDELQRLLIDNNVSMASIA